MDNSTSLYIPPRVAAKKYGVTRDTLAKWTKKGKIRFVRCGTGITSAHRYLSSDIERHFNVLHTPSTERAIIIYARVSSTKQKEAGDLARQVKQLKEYCPNYDKVIQDVASGLNFKRRGLTSLLDAVESGNVWSPTEIDSSDLVSTSLNVRSENTAQHSTWFRSRNRLPRNPTRTCRRFALSL